MKFVTENEKKLAVEAAGLGIYAIFAYVIYLT